MNDEFDNVYKHIDTKLISYVSNKLWKDAPWDMWIKIKDDVFDKIPITPFWTKVIPIHPTTLSIYIPSCDLYGGIYLALPSEK
jgi:hypothetical protein